MYSSCESAVLLLLGTLAVFLVSRSGGQLYVLDDQLRNNSQALEKCVQLGFDGLAIVDSNQTTTTALKLIKTPGAQQYWVGMHYSESQSMHMWDTGIPVSWALWASDEPDNLPTDKCVRFRTTQLLGTFSCSSQFMAMCGMYTWLQFQVRFTHGKAPTPGAPSLWSGTARSLVECVTRCTKDIRCQHCAYDNRTLRCLTLPGSFDVVTGTVTSETGLIGTKNTV
ncbi:uncharacterized protein LOC131928110 [Physella acuta]|uniref:uncharacterized protein LOC131928110 n=1 Tax=Physella acuta TaxID=109671 RepID=UPI0027DCAA44|nr:uncharacterized protein LOC131928110 [Physella acuta]